MKKYLSILCVLAIMGASVSCVAEESSENKGTVSIGSSSESSEVAESSSDSEVAESTENSATEEQEVVEQKAEQIIYDANDIKITYTGFTHSGLFQDASFDFLIENNSAKNILITSKNVSVNDYSITDFLYEEINAGKKSNSGVTIYDYLLEENDIESIGKIEFNLEFSDPETYETLYISDKITITLDETVDLGGVPEGSQLLHEQNGIAVYYVKNTGATWLVDDGIKFFVQNDTDKNVVVSTDNVTVNDFTLDLAMLYAETEAYKKANDIMEFYSSELEENGITDINKVDFTLRCYDSETYDDLWETDVITITME